MFFPEECDGNFVHWLWKEEVMAMQAGINVRADSSPLTFKVFNGLTTLQNFSTFVLT